MRDAPANADAGLHLWKSAAQGLFVFPRAPIPDNHERDRGTGIGIAGLTNEGRGSHRSYGPSRGRNRYRVIYGRELAFPCQGQWYQCPSGLYRDVHQSQGQGRPGEQKPVIELARR